MIELVYFIWFLIFIDFISLSLMIIVINILNLIYIDKKQSIEFLFLLNNVTIIDWLSVYTYCHKNSNLISNICIRKINSAKNHIIFGMEHSVIIYVIKIMPFFNNIIFYNPT